MGSYVSPTPVLYLSFMCQRLIRHLSQCLTYVTLFLIYPIPTIPFNVFQNKQGWLYGIKDGRYGLFPSDFVERMSPTAVRREMKMISKAGHNGAHSRNTPSPIDDRFDRSKVQRNSAGDESEDGDEEQKVVSILTPDDVKLQR